ncbi:MAG: 4Fe-4S dicluster domain-containing protein [Clostridia bacterium]|nr:4Fe-4S dicluster domain-containing protein [Clostridia bacterium]MBR0407253.1 4Fe-4S dicluster domain-containing protein [Clostridia bacterium]
MEQTTNRYHSVRLDVTRCKGCTNCLKHCPTEAIRVRDGRAHIIDERCIDCGECIRICEYHAKVAVTDNLSAIKGFPHAIALPAPSLYGQFKEIKSISPVLDALKAIGFEEVFEVARGADVVSRAIKEKLREPGLPRPLISSACPAVVRLIQVRFPDLIPHIVDIRQPIEVAAEIARDEFCRKHNCPPEDVGVFFITPCPAKMTAIRSPIGQQKSAVDGAISVMEIYGKLMPHIGRILTNPTQPSSTIYGVRWAASSGEADAVCPDNSLAVDGIQNVSRVLEEIENNMLSDLVFFEGNACTGGCVGGPLNFENNYVAKNAIRKLSRACSREHPTEHVPASMMTKYPLYFDATIEPNPAMKLDDNIVEAMKKMSRMNAILDGLPGYDCGSCGSPTCRTFAEDIVRGNCSEMDCIHKLKDQLKIMAERMVELAQTRRE